MIPYLLIVFIPVFFCAMLNIKKEEFIIGEKCSVHIGKVCLAMFFFGLFLLLALRNETLGLDLPGYKRVYFLGTKNYSYYDILRIFLTAEPLWYIINKIVLEFTENFNILMAVVAVLSIFPMAYTYCKCSQNWFLEMVLFLFTPTYAMLFSGIRQAFAISLGLLSYLCVKNKKYGLYIFICICAFSIHRSAIMLLTILPLYKIRITKKWFPLIFGMAILLFVFNDKILLQCFNFLRKINVYTGYLRIINTGEYGNVLLYPIFVIFAFLITDEKKMDQNAFGLRNILVFMLFIQMFAPLNYMVMRVNYYYISLMPIILSTMIECSSDDNKQIAQIAKLCLCGLFVLVYAKEVYSGCYLGVQYLGNYPYVPFWK